ncbi:MAG: hypothetical protein K0Q68_11 [Moraxellaceae bacterium]|jgi:hypothetical protein|nr:hypothetical protein [Moraxellaceae bacterium]
MNKALKFTGLLAIAALAVLLYTLRHTDGADTPAVATTTGIAPGAKVIAATPASPAAASAETGATTALPATPQPGSPSSPSDNTVPAIPDFVSGEQRDATRAARQEVMPAFLKAADATLAQVRTDIEKLKAAGAPAAEIQAAEARLQQLTAVREQVLARNADIPVSR